jgi:hypothetical protein
MSNWPIQDPNYDRYKSHEKRWCVITCRGYSPKDLYMTEEARPLGMRVNGVGIVPYSDYRLATDQEVKDYLKRIA